MSTNEFVIEPVTEPEEIQRHRAQIDRAKRNSDWLQAHWADLFPAVRGRYVAVAGQEAFVAETAEEVWFRARTAHPEVDGASCQYVFPRTGPRFYGHRRRMEDL
jgi:hypothetical protein